MSKTQKENQVCYLRIQALKEYPLKLRCLFPPPPPSHPFPPSRHSPLLPPFPTLPPLPHLPHLHSHPRLLALLPGRFLPRPKPPHPPKHPPFLPPRLPLKPPLLLPLQFSLPLGIRLCQPPPLLVSENIVSTLFLRHLHKSPFTHKRRISLNSPLSPTSPPTSPNTIFPRHD